MNKKFCVKCGREFYAIGREVICPSCKAAAAEESKRAAVERAKRASWAGESVPVRISGRASTVIREYGAANNLPFAQALDALLKNTPFFLTAGKAWEDVEPYKSHRRDKTAGTTETTSTTEGATDKQDAPQAAGKPQEVTKAAKASKHATAAKKAVKTSKAAAGKGGKA